MQRKLTEVEIEKLKQARSGISDVLFPAYGDHGQYLAGVLFSLDDNIKHGTSDGKPWVEPEPPLTDKDACVWPRRWVMVRNKNYDAWEGPFEFVGKTVVSDDDVRYSVWDKSGYHRWYTQTRRATPEEIEAMSRK